MLRALIAFLLTCLMVVRPEDVPKHWQPWSPLDLLAAPNPVSDWKLRSLALRPEACRVALAAAARGASMLPDREDSEVCHIRNRVRLTGLGTADLAPVETRCTIAARMLAWETHSVQPAARALLGAEVARIHHYSSFSCRKMRTNSGGSTRMSQHATANAIDVSGFTLSDGRRINLKADWSGDDAAARFLREARDGLCDWFNIVLSPDYNALHADHFHADMGHFLICR